MACQVFDRVVLHQGAAQAGQGFILFRFEDFVVLSFEFDPDRVVVAMVPSPVRRDTGVPGPVGAADKLPEHAVTPNEKVGRHFHIANRLEIRVGLPVQLVGEELRYASAAVLTGGQADRVNDDQVDLGMGWTRAEVRRIEPVGMPVPAFKPQACRPDRL